MSLIGDISDPKKDVEALRPLVLEAMDRLSANLKAIIDEAIDRTLDGRTITINAKEKI